MENRDDRDGRERDSVLRVSFRHLLVHESVRRGRSVYLVRESGPYERVVLVGKEEVVSFLAEHSKIHREVAEDYELAAAALKGM